MSLSDALLLFLKGNIVPKDAKIQADGEKNEETLVAGETGSLVL